MPILNSFASSPNQGVPQKWIVPSPKPSLIFFHISGVYISDTISSMTTNFGSFQMQFEQEFFMLI